MLPLLFAAALALPVPSSPPIPVSPTVFGAAPLDQSGVRVASNGSIALAVWNDRRAGRSDVTATRVTADGRALDPNGIVVQIGTELRDIFWNGTAFVVVTGPTFITEGHAFIVSYVTPEGEVTGGDVLAPEWELYGGRTGEGADARYLFLPPDGSPALARLVDSHGHAIREGDYRYDSSQSVFATGNGSGFLELRGVAQNPFIAYLLDRDGNVVQTKDPQLPASFEGVTLAADGHGGYALFGVLQGNQLAVVPLDANGVATGPPQVLQQGDPYDWLQNGKALTVTAAGGTFVASWFDSDGRVYVSRNGGAPVMAFDCSCYDFGFDAAYEPVNDLLFVSDVVPLSVEIRGAAVLGLIMRFSSPGRQTHQGL